MGDVSVMRRALEEIQEGKELAIATITKSQGSILCWILFFVIQARLIK